MKNTTLDFESLLPVPNTFTIGTEEYNPRPYKANETNVKAQ